MSQNKLTQLIILTVLCCRVAIAALRNTETEENVAQEATEITGTEQGEVQGDNAQEEVDQGLGSGPHEGIQKDDTTKQVTHTVEGIEAQDVTLQKEAQENVQLGEKIEQDKDQLLKTNMFSNDKNIVTADGLQGKNSLQGIQGVPQEEGGAQGGFTHGIGIPAMLACQPICLLPVGGYPLGGYLLGGYLLGGYTPGGGMQVGYPQGGGIQGGYSHGGIQGGMQGGVNQGGYPQGGYPQGGGMQGGYPQGGMLGGHPQRGGMQGGHHQGGGMQGMYPQGGVNQGGYPQGGGMQGMYPQGGVNQGGYPQGGMQGGYPQGGYPLGGGIQGDYPQGGGMQGMYPQGGVNQGGYPQGGMQGGYPQGGMLGGYPQVGMQGGYPQGGMLGGHPQRGGMQGGHHQGGGMQGGHPQGVDDTMTEPTSSPKDTKSFYYEERYAKGHPYVVVDVPDDMASMVKQEGGVLNFLGEVFPVVFA